MDTGGVQAIRPRIAFWIGFAAAFTVMASALPSAYAGDAVVLVKDINTLPAGSTPTPIVAWGNAVFFAANDSVHGTELFKSDGTPGNAVLVKDIFPGEVGSCPAYLTVVNDTLYFAATDGVNGSELWQSDGTEAGTVLVKDICPGSGSSTPRDFINVNGTLFFAAADDGIFGQELWKSDGTQAGTVCVKDINPGVSSSDPGRVSLAAMNGVLYFSADDGTHGNELWKTDGSKAGTVMVKDINPSGYSYPTSPTNVNGVLFFAATSAGSGTELWKTDGTDAGTVLVKDIRSGSGSSSPQYLANLNDQLCFSANDGANGAELWTTDGTTDGTVMLKDICPGTGGSSPQYLTAVGNILYFSASDGTAGNELWTSDGTTGGTVMLKEIVTGLSGSTPNGFLAVNGSVFFAAFDFTNGYELWKTDGTTPGTILIKDILPGPNGSSPRDFMNLNNALMFSADDGTHGFELWKSDGTSGGTIPIQDLNTATVSSSPGSFATTGSTLYFRADDGVNGSELWKSDGTASGIALVKNIRYSSFSSAPANLTVAGSTVFFTANDGSIGAELWKSDGTTADTVLVKDIRSGGSSSTPANLTAVNTALFFTADDGTNGTELWKSDGTSAGTVIVKDIYTGSGNSSNPGNLANFNGMIFFAANDGTSGTELWKSDGTSAGTVRVKDICSGAASSAPANLTVVNGWLYFAANDGASGIELWKSDGTAANTVMVKDINPGDASSSPMYLTNAGGVLYFAAYEPTHYAELWKSDGTSDGTVLVRNDAPVASDLQPSNLANINGTIYFQGYDAVTGYELWKSDGTAAGTAMVKDIAAAAASSSPANFVAIDQVVYFSASDGVHGTELWRSDGTGPGTYAARDIFPGIGSSSPSSLTLMTGALFFAANDCVHGVELWTVYPAPVVTSIVRLDPNPTAASSVNFQVTFSESVTGVDATDFALTALGTLSGVSVAGVTGSGSVYTVTVNTGTGSGSLRLDVHDDDSIKNGALKSLGGAGVGNGDFTSGEAYTVRATPPVAAFAGVPATGNTPLLVQFTDQSTPGSFPIAGWRWDFGDGATSADQNPNHTYTACGSFAVTLTVTTNAGNDAVTRPDYVQVHGCVSAAFTADTTTGLVGLTVQFTDQSMSDTLPITSWAWTFGDGGLSTDQNPAHTYTTPGAYAVSLTVTTAAASDTETKTGYISCFERVYVDAYNTSNADGTSWATAFRRMQNGIDAAFAVGGCEVWVAQGIYGASVSDPDGAVGLKPGVHVYGGFVGKALGGFETSRGQRNWSAHETRIDGTGTRAGSTAYHVIKAADNATLDGFTITGGDASGTGTAEYGGGLYIAGVSPTIAHCTLRGNAAAGYGGAAVIRDGAAPVFLDCIFHDNSAFDNYGGAVANLNGAAPSFTNCLFYNNYSKYGGAFYNSGSITLTLMNCTLSGNSAASGTTSGFGGAIYGGTTNATNCIIWGNTPSGIYGGSGANLTYTDTQDDWAGEGNFRADPCYWNSAAGDYRLTGNSSCLDRGTSAGAPAADLIGTPRPVRAAVDLGAYEYPGPLASFTANVTDGTAPLLVRFTDQSSPGLASIASWSWNFSGGAYSTEPSPSHLFSAPGYYRVTLTVSNALGTSSASTYVKAGPVVQVYVDKDNVSGQEDGVTWATAFRRVQDGMNMAALANASEVWVAEGTYSGYPVLTVNSGVQVYGGFAATETQRNQRDWNAHATVLAGYTGLESGADQAVLDGFTITSGFPGVNIVNCSPTISHCRFTANGGVGQPGYQNPSGGNGGPGESVAGGALWVQGGSPHIISCVFADNHVTGGRGGDGMGSGWCVCFNGGNGGSAFGAAVKVAAGTPSFTNCVFYHNVCTGGPGGYGTSSMYCGTCANGSPGAGLNEAIYNQSSGAVTLTNCTFSGHTHSAPISGGVLIVKNCILWGNGSPALSGSSVTVSYSDVQGGFTGTGNINADPLFVDQATGNLQLSSGASPCVDTGTASGAPSVDILGIARPQGSGFDMGAYELISLPEALDNVALAWTTGGTVPWFGQMLLSHDGVDAAQSGALAHNQSSELTTQVTGPGTLSFWWKVSSEAGHDFLRFSVDGVLQDRISGDVYFNQKQYVLGEGTHLLKWKYSKDAAGTAGRDAAWLDQVVWSPLVISLADALDNTALAWTTTGNAGWLGQAVITHDHVDAAQSGTLTDGQSSEFSTQITGPGTVSFWWKVSSQPGHDFLRFSIDGVLQGRISGDVYFNQKQYALGSGTHLLKWKYSRDASGAAGRDAAWVDEVIWTPDGKALAEGDLRISSALAGGWTRQGDSHTLTAETAGGRFPLEYQWQKDGQNLVGATEDTLTIASATESDSGTYMVVVRDVDGNTSSASATLKVTDSLPAPVGIVIAAIVVLCGLAALRRKRD